MNGGLSVRVCKVQWLCVCVNNRPGLWCHFLEMELVLPQRNIGNVKLLAFKVKYYLTRRRKTNFYHLKTIRSLYLNPVVSWCDTCEELQVGKRFGQHPATLLLHWQGDDHETVSQLWEVFDEVVVPAERNRTVRRTDVCFGFAACGKKKVPAKTEERQIWSLQQLQKTTETKLNLRKEYIRTESGFCKLIYSISES